MKENTYKLSDVTLNCFNYKDTSGLIKKSITDDDVIVFDISEHVKLFAVGEVGRGFNAVAMEWHHCIDYKDNSCEFYTNYFLPLPILTG